MPTLMWLDGSVDGGDTPHAEALGAPWARELENDWKGGIPHGSSCGAFLVHDGVGDRAGGYTWQLQAVSATRPYSLPVNGPPFTMP